MAVFTYTADYYGHSFKSGSTWTFHFTRKAGTPAVPVDITGLTSRVMFRASGVDGPVIATLGNSDITNGGALGTIALTLSATQTALFSPGVWHYLDIEMTAPGGYVWQSPTMRFKPEQEVTRP
jgi:hypothetical protein